MQVTIQLGLICILLAFSFIFSGSEVSFLSISDHERTRLAREKGGKNALLIFFLRHSQNALVTILVGNMVVNTSASIIGEQLSSAVFMKNELFYSVFFMTFMILLLGEIVPKNIAAARPIPFAKTFVRLIRITNRVFYPLIAVLLRIVTRGEVEERRRSLSKQELISAVETSTEAGLDRYSIVLLKNLTHLIELPITDIMVHRHDIESVDVDDHWEDIEKSIGKSSLMSILFHRESIDNVIGYITKFDLLGARKKDLLPLMVKPLFIPESKHIFTLLQEFKRSGKYLAIVLDEYGGTSGLVTMKDIMDAIFIKDVLLRNFVQQVDTNRWIVKGDTSIPDLNDAFDTNLPTEPNTISGFITAQTGAIPPLGYELEIEGYRAKVIGRDERQIELLEITPRDR
jgi:putative hemolysin